MSLNEEAFDVLHENLTAAKPEYHGTPVILCPVCLREVHRDDVIARGVEHIIPQVVIKADRTPIADLGTKNQRCGLTVLCRSPRQIRGTGEETRDGCNGFKGRVYDWAFRHLLDEKIHAPEELTHRHGVAILTMAYLAAFQMFGYEYILQDELGEIREQFDHPDAPVTHWLEHALYNLGGNSGIYASESGMPFVFGGLMTADSALHVIFRRCQAYLPRGHWQARGVRSLESLLPRS